MNDKDFKIAVPIFEGRIAPRLDTAWKMLLVSIEDGKIKDEEEVRAIGLHPLKMSLWFKQEGVTVVICSGVDEICSRSLIENGILIFTRIAGCPREAVRSYLDGSLANMAIPTRPFGRGCKRGRFRGGSGGTDLI